MTIEKKSNKSELGKRGGAREGAGRKPGSLNKATADIKAFAQEYGEQAIKTLADLMLTAEADSAKIAAAKELLDRGYGKSTQYAEIAGKDGVAIQIDIAPKLSKEEWMKAHGLTGKVG